MATIGIDFGTTNTVASVVDEFGNGKVIPSSEGEDLTPTVMCFEDGDNVTVGREAVNQQLAQPEETISEFKLLLGSKEVLYTTKSGKRYTAKECAEVVLEKVKRDAEQYLGEKVDGAVITVPANFTDSPKQDLLDAANQAGLKVLQLLHEPPAGAIAYSLGKGQDQDQRILVFDLGGGTFDASIVQCRKEAIEVLGTDGIKDLGGRKFTQAIMDFLLQQIDGDLPDLKDEPAFYQDLKDRAEQAKFALGVKQSTKITLCVQGVYQTIELTLDKFNEMIEPLIEQTVAKCESLLKQLGLEWNSIDKVLFVGGGSKVPAIKDAVEQSYGRSVSQDIDGMKAISYGAAIQAAILSADAEGNRIYQGRAIPAPKVDLSDVTAHGIGCTVHDPNRDNVCAIIIPRHSPIPSDKKDVFRFHQPHQTSVHVEILQGEEGQSRDECEVIGDIKLEDLSEDESLPLRLHVRYEIDKHGMVSAHAEDSISGKQADITFDYSKGVSRVAAS